MEALWRVSKIDLDHAIRDACHMILEGNHFLFPTLHGIDSGGNPTNNDGWIAPRSGETIYVDIARLRAAAAMVMIGDVFVYCSKQGTSWKE